MAKAKVRVGWSLRELAAENEPPVNDLDNSIARLRRSGATECVVAGEIRDGVMVESASAGAARMAPRAAIYVESRRVTVAEVIDWSKGGDSFGAAFRAVVESFQGLDQLARLRFAATDMRLVAGAAEGLLEIDEHDDAPARIFERVIETGLVVTYARPFLEAEAEVGKRWWPKARTKDRELHDELLQLRHEYHAHASHTPRRALENVSAWHDDNRLAFAESWEKMAPDQLRNVAELAERLAATFRDEADRIEAVLAEKLR